MPKTVKDTADYIMPLYINGLSGRMLRMPAKGGKKREFLLIYGMHTSLERMAGVAEYLNKYGGVTMPDLPGFGGMQSFYKIGEKPTLDNMADYLAAFIKLRYRNKKVTIVGFSLGFPIITIMLQKYPRLTSKIDLLGSMVGFVHHNDFTFSKKRYWIYRAGTRFLSYKIPAAFYKYVILRPVFIRYVYRHLMNAKEKFAGKEGEELKNAMELEVHLWRCNDPRTYMHVGNEMFKLDLTHVHVAFPVHHVAVSSDRYFNHVLVEQHMRNIFSDFYLHKTNMGSHMPSVVATAEMAAPFMPESLRQVLRSDPK